MNFYADYVVNKLNAAISSMSSQIEDYVRNPGHDFYQKSKDELYLDNKLSTTMEGGS